MEFRRWWTAVRDSLWFLPAIFVIASGVLAFGMITIDRLTPEFATSFPLIFGGGADGARGLLSSVAGSMITVAGVTFSITIVALQLASSQLSPRVLRNFMRDRSSQVVLGAFIGAFTYAILVLRSIRADAEGITAFVPSLAVSVGILYALLALGMFVYFIHHIASRIQLSAIVANIADETTAQVRRDWREGDDDDEPRGLPADRPARITAGASGYLQLVDLDGLRDLAAESDVVVRLEVTPGDWVQEDAPLFAVWPADRADDGLAELLRELITVGAQRSIEQDAAFGIRQLVDVGLKAISPGINDPTSASDCIVRLGQILVAAGRRAHPGRTARDDDGRLRLVVPYHDWDDLLGLAFDQMRQYSAGSADVSIALCGTLRTIALAVPERRHGPIRRQLELIGESAKTIELESDRRHVTDAVERALDTTRA